jgi:hypothetical protein
MRRALLQLALGSAILPLVAACGGDPPPCGVTVTTAAARVPQWSTFTTAGRVAAFAEGNPFDPAQIDLWAELTAPSGAALRIPGFFYQDYERALVENSERLTPKGDPVWMARFTPTETGAWRWRWRVRTPRCAETTPWQTFEATAPEASAHGFLRVSAEDPRYLRFDDGTPYFAVGENVGWYDGRGTFAYDRWFAALRAQGANFARVWMPSWAFGLEWISRGPDGGVADSTLGDYAKRLTRAWQLDRVLEAAREAGIYVLLCLQNHGAFSLSVNSEWADNPYNALNGGPLESPQAFFTDATAQALFERRLRYVVARWGHSPHVLAWELWNEVDYTEERDAAVLAPWHARMADYLQAIDPHRHLVTTSVAALAPLLGLDQALFRLPQIAFAQLHLYGHPGSDPDFTEEVPELVAPLLALGKPVLAAELGVDYRGPAETMARDPHASGFHDLLWSGVFAQTFGTGMTWWWDNLVDPQNLYTHLGPIVALTQGIAFHREGFRPGGARVAAAGRNLAPFALRGRSVGLAWVKNRDNLWYQGWDESPVEGAVLELDVEDGRWEARWIDPYGGSSPASAQVTAQGGRATLAVPAFSKDVALRLERVP